MIAGGKYTTYRVMARDAVDAAAADLGGAIPPSRTAQTPLVGATGVDPLLDRRMVERHGGCAGEVLALAAADRELARPIAGAERYLAAEAVHACTHQGALDLDDILSRRMRISIEVPDRGRAAAATVAPLVAPVLGWSQERVAEEVGNYVRLRDAEAAAEAAPDDATARERYQAVMRG
jgi:glycerol-3-phosphate dehydrogenase